MNFTGNADHLIPETSSALLDTIIVKNKKRETKGKRNVQPLFMR